MCNRCDYDSQDNQIYVDPLTKQNPIDFNDIDVSNLDSFYNNKGIGIFEETKFKHINISDWDVSNIKSMRSMFYVCEELESTVIYLQTGIWQMM